MIPVTVHPSSLENVMMAQTRTPPLLLQHRHRHAVMSGSMAPAPQLFSGVQYPIARITADAIVCNSSSDGFAAPGTSNSTALVSQKSAAKRKVGRRIMTPGYTQ